MQSLLKLHWGPYDFANKNKKKKNFFYCSTNRSRRAIYFAHINEPRNCYVLREPLLYHLKV